MSKPRVTHPITVKVNERALEHQLNEIFFEDSMCPAFSETSILVGRYKGYQIQITATRDEGNMMDDNCDLKIVKISKAKQSFAEATNA